MRARQEAGLIASGLDPAALRLMAFALASYPRLLPQIARMTTGHAPESPEFHELWDRFLRQVGPRLAPDAAVVAPPVGAGRQFYVRHLAYLQAGDVEGLIDDHYRADAVLVRSDVTVRGRDELIAYFRGYLERLGHLGVLSTDAFVETGDAIFFEATVASALGRARVYDAFVLREGKISHHFAGVLGAA